MSLDHAKAKPRPQQLNSNHAITLHKVISAPIYSLSLPIFTNQPLKLITMFNKVEKSSKEVNNKLFVLFESMDHSQIGTVFLLS